jgi:hypothetical protein
MINKIKNSITVNAVNLNFRKDRKQHILSQYKNKAEFSLNIIPAIEHERGATGLWQTIQGVVKKEMNANNDFFIFCEDDHEFTSHYSSDFLMNCIQKAIDLDADILSGGVSWFHNGIQVSNNLFWIDVFNGLQFTVIFKKFYQVLLNANFGDTVVADFSISTLTDKKFVIFPFISTQKEFGYSDITSHNNTEGCINAIFTAASNRLEILNKVRKFYFPE